MASNIVGAEKIPGSIRVTRGEDSLRIFESYRYLVYSDDPEATRQSIVFTTPNLPIVGILYAQNGLVCESVNADRQASNPNFWDVVCEFESGREDQRQSASNPTSADPTTWIPVFRIGSFETRQKVLIKDKSDPPKPILNAAGQKFETPLVQNVTLSSWVFVQFETPSLTLQEIQDRNDTINTNSITSNEVGTFPPETLKLNITEAELGYYAGFPAWRIGYKVTYDKDKWITKLLNIGSLFKDGAGNLQPYMDETETYRIYGNLALDGTKQSPVAEPLELEFSTYDKISFSFIRTA
jgi:hypothetical protein